ncbi:hypothetical protein HH308_01280 [Gordonia sp. TBRC 11910]|uniref:Uncharacterized protein n=1 Tax=Gordonia asplenii TaxID=2725283 RepID=A0A848KMF2_9ACTN|nr:hypothetical protein [Gordonia asplenii]NMN99845.1 hypothetical protein [Gordonia asplenii]
METVFRIAMILGGALVAGFMGIIALNIVLVSRLRAHIPQESPSKSWPAADV